MNEFHEILQAISRPRRSPHTKREDRNFGSALFATGLCAFRKAHEIRTFSLSVPMQKGGAKHAWMNRALSRRQSGEPPCRSFIRCRYRAIATKSVSLR